MEPDEDKIILSEVSVTKKNETRFEQTSSTYENYTKDEFNKQTEEIILKIDDVKGGCWLQHFKICLSDEDENKVVTEQSHEEDSGQYREEPCQSVEDSIIDNDTKLQLTLPKIEDIKGGCWLQHFKIWLSDEDENNVVTEQPHTEVSEQNICAKEIVYRINNSEVNDKLSQSKEKCNTDHLSNQNDTIGVNNKPYSCNVCAFRSKWKGALLLHLRIHTNIKPFSCHLCPYKSNRKYNLQQHLITHTGEKPFSCYICSYTSSHKSNLKSHLRTHK